MHRADRGERPVTRTERVRLPVHLSLDLAGEEEVCLLERVVVLLGRSADLVVDREHRRVIGAERAVDQHLHRDAAVRQERGVHPGRLPAASRIADSERLELRPRALVMPDIAERRIAERRTPGDRLPGRHVLGRLEIGVGPPGARVLLLRRIQRDEADRRRSGVRKPVPHPGRHKRVVATGHPVDALADQEQRLALEDVEDLLVAVDMRREPAAGVQHDRRQVGMHGALGPADEPLAHESTRHGARCRRRIREGPIEMADDVLGGAHQASWRPGTSRDRRPSTNQMPCTGTVPRL